MSPAESAILAAAMDRILPSSVAAGATAANAIGYAHWIAGHESFRPYVSCMTTGLSLLEDTAAAMHGRGFCACQPAERDCVIAAVWRLPHPLVARFFVMLVRMTLAGFLCDPRCGGNRDRAGWRFIGYSPPPAGTAGPSN